MFTKGFVIGKANYPRTKSNVNWSYLNKLAIPGKEGKRSYIWPSGVHPYCGYSTRLREVAKHGVSESRFQGVFDKIHTCGYYPVWLDGYNVGGKTFFNLIFRRANARWQARINMTGARYQKEFKKWTRSGYRPIHVDSYQRKGKMQVRRLMEKVQGLQVHRLSRENREFASEELRKTHPPRVCAGQCFQRGRPGPKAGHRSI